MNLVEETTKQLSIFGCDVKHHENDASGIHYFYLQGVNLTNNIDNMVILSRVYFNISNMFPNKTIFIDEEKV